MCIICIKKKGIEFPSVEIVKTMCNNNPHGFSIVWHDGKQVHRFRTMEIKDFLNTYKKISDGDYEKTSLFIHARIKTHGTTKLSNCHGWRDSGLIFAHNGILSIANRDDMTDSETFFRDIFIPAYKVGGWKLGERTIEAIIGTSKFVFMNTNGDIRHYGKYITDNGVLYSNNTYLPYDMSVRCAHSCVQSRYRTWWERRLDTFDSKDMIF
jgi:predicted glutamine amidotransferase